MQSFSSETGSNIFSRLLTYCPRPGRRAWIAIQKRVPSHVREALFWMARLSSWGLRFRLQV